MICERCGRDVDEDSPYGDFVHYVPGTTAPCIPLNPVYRGVADALADLMAEKAAETLSELMETKPELVEFTPAPAPAVSAIYQLTEYQYNVLKSTTAEGGSVCFAHIDSAEGDPDKTERDAQRTELLALIELGLMSDVTNKFSESLTVSKLNNKNRGFIVLCLTENGIIMFRNGEGSKN